MATNDVNAEAQQEVDTAEADVAALEGETEEVQDTTDWKAKYEEAEGRRKRAESKLEKSKIDKKVEEKLSQKSGELDETQLDYLDLKGITESEDIDFIQRVVQRTGQTVRQALKDDIVVEKLKANQAKREVSAATPSSTKRGGSNQNNDVGVALAKYEATGELPTDFKLRSAVVNAKMEKETSNKPAWH